MHIKRKNENLTEWLSETLDEMRLTIMPTVEQRCPHCGLPIRYPLIARESDIKLFENLMRSAFDVMLRHGITANLLADIRTQCIIAIAQKHD